jgi:hypothetical protein
MRAHDRHVVCPGRCVGRLRAERENAELVEDSRAV